MNPFDDPLKELREGKPKINEGFICPECMKKFATITGLVQHVELKHPTEEKSQSRSANNEKSTSRKLKIFGNFRKKANGFPDEAAKNDPVNGTTSSTSAIRKSLNPFEDDEEAESQALSNDDLLLNGDAESEEEFAAPVQAETIPVQHMGPLRSHWHLFSGQREQRTERNKLFTNKLIIRLERILAGYPELDDFYKRKAHEQKVVEWIPASLVPHCPICTAKFGLLFGSAGGQHHCRLCGCVMCSRCSKFYSFETACKLIGSPVLKPKSAALQNTGGKPKMNLSSLGKVLSFLSFELNPDLDPERWDQLRVCLHCDHQLHIRLEKSHLPSAIPLVQFYDLIVHLKQEIEKNIEVYRQMYDSLQRGKADYKLVDAKKLQIDIGMMCQQVNRAREKIALMKFDPFDLLPNIDDPIPDLESRQALAQRSSTIQANICRSVVSWCQRYAITLPALPTEAEYEILKKEHDERIQRRINREKAILRKEQQLTDHRHRSK